jgi:transcription elongation GreA/GreB family factor
VNYITSGGLAKLHADLEALQQQKRNLSAAPAPAGTPSDLDIRIKDLQEILSEVVVPKPSPKADPGRARFGSRVNVRSAISGTHTYQIVGVEETDVDQNEISWLSPLAKALIGKRAGDKVEFRSPSGKDILEILEVTSAER